MRDALKDFNTEGFIDSNLGLSTDSIEPNGEDGKNIRAYQLLTQRFTTKELLTAWFMVLCFILAYLLCYIYQIRYASLLHSRILYGVFVFFNVSAAAMAMISWNRIPNRSIAKDAMLFFAILMVSAAIGNSMDYLFWVTEITSFKQSVFTNLFFIFAILLAMPGIHLLGRVCRVEFSKQPVIYYLTIISIYILIPTLMNSSSLGSVSESDNFKEFIFGLLYAIGIGYLAAIAIHLWRTAKGRLFLAARLLCLGMIAMSFGCAIYAGLFPRTPAAEIPSSPVHIIIALGYVVCALGIRRTEQTINSIFNLKASKLPPWFTLVELFGKSEGLDVYKRLEENIKATLNELSKAKLETQAKLVAIGELEQEIKLRKKTERDLIFAKEKAEEANRAKSQFLAMMSHELKTPLTAIKGYGELLRGPGAQTLVENEKLGEVAQQIVINANNLQGMIEGVLQFSQLESGQFTYRKEKFRIADILTYLRSIINEQIDSDAVEYIEKIPDPELAVMTDKHSLQHIIVNLLVNAFKFCKKGHICLEIRKSGDKDLYVAVEDTGIGISNEYREKIFQAFYQISHGNKRKYGGTGLGLSIVKKIVEELNGQIELDSCVGKGTKFEIFLPDIIFKEPEDEHEST